MNVFLWFADGEQWKWRVQGAGSIRPNGSSDIPEQQLDQFWLKGYMLQNTVPYHIPYSIPFILVYPYHCSDIWAHSAKNNLLLDPTSSLKTLYNGYLSTYNLLVVTHALPCLSLINDDLGHTYHLYRQILDFLVATYTNCSVLKSVPSLIMIPLLECSNRGCIRNVNSLSDHWSDTGMPPDHLNPYWGISIGS